MLLPSLTKLHSIIYLSFLFLTFFWQNKLSLPTRNFRLIILIVNPYRLGGLNLCIAGGGAFGAPPLEKALENRYRVEMQVHSPIFHGQFREKKIDR